MTRFLTNHFALFLSLITLAFFFIGYLIWGADPPRIVFGSLLIGALATLMVILTGPAISAFRRGVREGGDNILISQWGVFSLLLWYFAWIQYSTWYRLHFGQEAANVLRESPVGGLFTVLFFIVSAYTILAPINTSADIEKPSLTKWLMAVALGSALAAVLATLSFMGIVDYFLTV